MFHISASMSLNQALQQTSPIYYTSCVIISIESAVWIVIEQGRKLDKWPELGYLF